MTSIIAMTFLIGFAANEAYAGVGSCEESCEDDFDNDLNVCAESVVATIVACGEGDNTDAVLQVLAQDTFCIAVGWDGLCENQYLVLNAGVPLSACGIAAVNELSSSLCVITAHEDIDMCIEACFPNGEVDIDIDIKPNSDPNSINTKSMGVVPVAILGSDTLDVTDVVVSTLMFGNASPAHDLSDPDTYNEHIQDVNGDGFLDLVSHYKQKDIGIACGDTEATLTADLLDGTTIEGTDSVNPKGC